MFQTIVTAVLVSVVLYLGYIVIRAYFPQKESFVVEPRQPTRVNTPPPPIPAPAVVVKQDPPQEERKVAPGGPNPPNAAPPAGMGPTISPDAMPIDPYADNNMESPIQDSMRHPEMSFGPGVDNTGMNKMGLSGVGSATAAVAETTFSPDFAQNGSSFMGSVFANDLTKGDAYATA